MTKHQSRYFFLWRLLILSITALHFMPYDFEERFDRSRFQKKNDKKNRNNLFRFINHYSGFYNSGIRRT